MFLILNFVSLLLTLFLGITTHYAAKSVQTVQ